MNQKCVELLEKAKNNPRGLRFTELNGKAKAYQVRQLIDFIEENDLDKPGKKE